MTYNILQTKQGLKIQNRFSVPHTEPCVKEVFSVKTCVYCRFESQAPEWVLLVNDPRMLWLICAGRCMLYTHEICEICVISFALTLSVPSFQINIRSRGGGGQYCPPGIRLILTQLGLAKNFLYKRWFILYAFESNIWNHVRADRRAITLDIKWPVKYGQSTMQK